MEVQRVSAPMQTISGVRQRQRQFANLCDAVDGLVRHHGFLSGRGAGKVDRIKFLQVADVLQSQRVRWPEFGCC